MAEKSKLSTFFSNLKGEYKKIIWPDFKNLCKQTYTVIMTCIFFGLIVFFMDIMYGFGMNFVIDFLSK